MWGTSRDLEGYGRAPEEMALWKRRCSIALASLMPTLPDADVAILVDTLAPHSGYLEPVEAALLISDWTASDHLPKG
jgi:hypothetical protein